MRRFLEFVVGEALAGRSGELKESLIGVAVFDRETDYDPRIDPIVRVEARRLRTKLEQYYRDEASAAELRIELPRGTYAPVFHGSKPAPLRLEPPTIAVLPFENLSAEPGDEFFSAGLTQELIHSLTRLPGLRVMAWNSTQRLRQREDLAHTKIPVDLVMEGTLRRSGSRVRIGAQLVDTATGLYVWAGSYERQARDLLAMQEELAQAIGQALHVRLADGHPGLRKAQPRTDAYTLYLKGRHALARRTEEGMRQAALFFEQATREAPEFALAHAGLADCHLLLCDYGFERGESGFVKARAAVQRALELDPLLAEAHVSLASILTSYDWAFERAEWHFRRAIELNPGYAAAHHWYGVDFLALLNRMSEAEQELCIALELNPLDPIVTASAAHIDLLKRDYGKAEERYRKLIREAPDFPKGWSGLGRLYATVGRYEEAIAMLEKARFLTGEEHSVQAVLGQVYGKCGEEGKARQVLAFFREEARRRHVATQRFALVHLGLGEKSEALDHVEAGFQRREGWLISIGLHPAYDDLRGEARFEAVVQGLGLPASNRGLAERA
ncbi:MAG: tetratricopeptide repeat protein [Bryobacterales bacterium]|nr:tetratricopeptide repeat protein [Bryobacterales bacterium]